MFTFTLVGILFQTSLRFHLLIKNKKVNGSNNLSHG